MRLELCKKNTKYWHKNFMPRGRILDVENSVSARVFFFFSISCINFTKIKFIQMFFFVSIFFYIFYNFFDFFLLFFIFFVIFCSKKRWKSRLKNDKIFTACSLAFFRHVGQRHPLLLFYRFFTIGGVYTLRMVFLLQNPGEKNAG